MINKNSKIFVAGHRGMIGSAVLRKLRSLNYKNIYFKKRSQLDLTNQDKVYNYLKKIKPEAVILAAAKVGGIQANNTFRAEFIYENLSIQNNVIHGSFKAGVKNLVFLGSSCIYPKNSKQPIKEDYLLSNYLEKTNEPYAVAKIAGVKLCESYNLQYKLNYKCLMPCNAYGINDNYDLSSSHFFPALIRKIIDALSNNKDYIKIWGSGKPLRELIYSDDIADACIFFLKKKTKESLINIGTGKEKNIIEYANFIMKHLGVKLKIIHEKKNLDGTLKKLLDISL
ncbi:MAG: GDP-fucose synthetase, partial [Rickettsiales bacterium]|nr:GDP-fucose synthetase [Rickettsiales bacterium]